VFHKLVPSVPQTNASMHVLSGLQDIFSLKCFAIAFFFNLIVPQETFFFFCVLQLKKRLGTTVNNQEISAFAD
jgi:hypothetical protein